MNTNFNNWYNTRTAEEIELYDEVMFLDNLFDDMTFKQGSTTGDYLLRNGEYKEYGKNLTITGNQFIVTTDETSIYDAYTNIEDKIIVINKKHIHNRATILHEMIHAHELILTQDNPLLKEIVLLELYAYLKERLPNLDTWIFNHANIHHNNDVAKIGGYHSLLFFLKSLDLDLRCNYEPFTVFGYDYARNFKELNLI